MPTSSTPPPSLPGTIKSAAPGLKGFDTVATISSAVAVQFKNSGYSFCIRYLSIGSGQNAGDLSFKEATAIINGGLALSAVQRVRTPLKWMPTKDLGTSTGLNAAMNANSIGLPKGMVLWCDFETPDPAATAQNVIDYCQAWYAAVSAAGYIPGLYVGAGAVLTSQQLYANLSYQHYWHSQSKVPDVAVRGYQMKQDYPSITVNGTAIDVDHTMNDNKGGAVLWLSL